MKIPIQSASIPARSTPGSAGYDLRSSENITIPAGDRELIGTGIRLAIPEGYAGLILPRSGLAKHGISITNAPGLVDSDFRGEMKVILENRSERDFHVEVGDRIAQIIFIQIFNPEFSEEDLLPSTVRGDGGFGSTGK